MKNKPEYSILALWLIAFAATLFIVNDKSIFTYLGPLYFICMVGSLITVRKAHS